MKFLFSSWLQSFFVFTPLKFRSLLMATLRCFYDASKIVLCRFWFLLIIDMMLFMLFGRVIFKTLNFAVTTLHAISIITVVVILLIEINWFIFSSAMLLFIRKKDVSEPLTYLKQSFFFYLQLLMFFYFLLFIIMAVFIALGITKLPQLPWICMASYTIAQLFTIFYWLDSSMDIKSTFTSLEKAVNCFLYNLPVVVFLLALLWGFDFIAKALFCGFSKALSLDSVILINKIEPFVKMYPLHLETLIKFLGLRYFVFFLKNLWICFVFVWYDRKKGIHYTKSFLDYLSEQQPPL